MSYNLRKRKPIQLMGAADQISHERSCEDPDDDKTNYNQDYLDLD